MTVSLDDLFSTVEPEDELAELLQLATTLELPTTSWVEGEPTLTWIELLAQRVSQLTKVVAPILAGGLLDYAQKGWLTLLAHDTFDTDRIEATFASTSVTFTNSSGTAYTVAAYDLTLESSLTGKTYKNTEGGTIPAGGTLSLTVVADEAGAESTAGIGEIDTLVTTLIGVTVSNPAVAIGLDEESDEALRARARLNIQALSEAADGPKGKFTYYAITPSKNGGAAVNRCDVRGDSLFGTITMVLAGPSGAVGSPDITLVTDVIVKKVLGPCETLSVVSSTNHSVDVTYSLWVYNDVNKSSDTLKAMVLAKLGQLFAVAPIGGWRRAADANGKVFVNLLESVIRSVTNRAFQVAVTLPAADLDLTEDEVPIVGTVAGTIVFEAPPATGSTVV